MVVGALCIIVMRLCRVKALRRDLGDDPRVRYYCFRLIKDLAHFINMIEEVDIAGSWS